MKEKARNITYKISALLLAIGVIGLMIAHLHWMAWVVLIGGLGYSSAHMALAGDSPEASPRIKRLNRIAIIAGGLWVAAAVTALNDIDIWALLILVAVVFMAYSNIALAVLKERTNKPSGGSNSPEGN